MNNKINAFLGDCHPKATVFLAHICYSINKRGGIMRQLLLASIALGGFAADSALAAELGAQPPVYEVATRWPGAQPPVYEVAAAWPGLFSWSGFYIGGHAGWGWANLEPTSITNNRNTNNRFVADGFVAGGQGGFNWQWNSIVLGIEADFSAKAFRGNIGFFPFDVFDKFDARWGSTARVRLGYAVDRWLFYATGGWAALNYRYISEITPFGPGVTSLITENGWVVGGGIEQAFAPNWSAKIEYLYADYGVLATNEFRFGLNYKIVPSY